MELKRRQIKVKERYGTYESKEDRYRKSFENAEAEFKEMYKTLSKKSKENINYNDELYKIKKQAEEVLSSKSLDDVEMVAKKSGDKPKSLSEYTKFIKKELHPQLILIKNNLIGKQVGGHSVLFAGKGEPIFICGIGLAGDNLIKPETTFEKIYIPEKDDWERRIEARGWLSSVEIISSWLSSHGLQPRKRNFI